MLSQLLRLGLVAAAGLRKAWALVFLESVQSVHRLLVFRVWSLGFEAWA